MSYAVVWNDRRCHTQSCGVIEDVTRSRVEGSNMSYTVVWSDRICHTQSCGVIEDVIHSRVE